MATSQTRTRSTGASDAAHTGAAAAAGETAAWKTWFLRLYEIPFITAVVAFAYWVRMQGAESLTVGGHTYFIGTDPYYHYRVTMTTLANFPFSIRWDPFTHFPVGTGTGQFGSLFNTGAAAFVMLKGAAGDPTAFGQAFAAYPAVLGALLFIPFYFLARALVGRVGAVFATVTLALIPGEFLVRSLAGYTDHHVAEALGMILAVWGAYATLEVGYRHRNALTWSPDWGALAKPLGVAALAGLGITAYFLFWPPAILVLGVLGAAFTLTLFVDHVRGEDTRYIAFAGVPFAVAGVLLMPTVETTGMNFNTFSLLQPVACLGLAGWLAGLHYASGALSRRELHPAILPAAAVGLGIAAFVALAVFAPSVYSMIKWGLSWVTGIGKADEIGTIAEARPTGDGFRREYGPLLLPVFVLSLFGYAFAYAWRRRRADVLLLVWSLVMFQAARTQVRFNYYFALVVALSVGWLAFMVADATGLNRGLARFFGRLDDAPAPTPQGKGGRKSGRRKTPDAPDAALRPGQFAAVAAVALVLLPGLVIPESGPDGSRSWTDCTRGAENQVAWVVGECFGGPGQNTMLWVDALHWMRDATPEAGFDLTERWRIADRNAGDFTYPEGTYGVLSWWDYGHYIQVEGERPPVANPFQNAAPFASCWLTETDPVRAEGFLRAWSERAYTRGGADACPDAPVPAPAEEPLAHPARYVMIDDEMAAGKFGAITVWAGVDDKFRERYDGAHEKTFRTEDGRNVDLAYTGEWYADTMLARLYLDDALTLDNYRLVHETRTQSLVGGLVELTDREGRIQNLGSLFNRYDPSTAPFEPGFRSGDRLINAGGNEYLYDATLTGSVKTFERVAGARVTGTGAPAGADVTIAIDLTVDTSGRGFTWARTVTADDAGRFSFTVPYATADLVAPENGGTDVAVRATGPAAVYVGSAADPAATVDVPDRAVLDGDVVRVALG